MAMTSSDTVFLCLFFIEDRSLSVLPKNDKNLNIGPSEFKEGSNCTMKWMGRREYQCKIVKIHDSKDFLHKWATKVNTSILKKHADSKDLDISELIREILDFKEASSSRKRKRIETARSKESKIQDDEISPKKKKSVKDKNEEQSSSKKTDEKVETEKLKKKRNTKEKKDEHADKSSKKTGYNMGRKKQTKEQEKKKLEASAAISMSMEIVSMASQFSKDADTPALAAPTDTQIEQEKEDINVVKSPTKRCLPITETKSPLTNRPAQTQIEQEKEDINIVKSPTKRCLPITETKSPLTNRPAQTQIEQEKEDINIVKSPTKRCLPITETKSPLTNRPAQTQIEQEKEDINIVKSPTKRCLPITETKSPLTNRPTPVNDFSDSAVNHSYIDMHLSRHHSTPLTETWGLCQRSMQFPISNNNCQSQAATNSNIPVPSPQVLETLRGILQPDFQTYAREFLDHFGHAQDHQNYSFQQSICNQTNYQGQGYNSFTESVMEYGNLSSEYYNLSPRRSPRLMKSSTPRLSQSANGIVKSTAPRRSLLPTLSEDDGGSATVTSIPASTATPQISVPHSNQREGNGSTTESGSYTPDCESSKQVKIKLLENCLFEVEKLALKKITAMARKNINPGYTLCLKMLPLLFTEEEMARSRGQGLIKPKPGDLRPSLDKNKILAVKDYVKSWCRKNNFSTPSEARLNDAITEKIAYCRKLMKKHQK